MGFRLNPSRSVGMRLFLIFFVSTLVFVLSLGFVSYVMSKTTIQDIARDSNQQTVNQTAEKLELLLDRYEESMQQSLRSKEVQELVRQGSMQAVDVRTQVVIKHKLIQALENWMIANPGVQGVTLIPESDTMPSVATGTVELLAEDDPKGESWFQQALDAEEALWLHEQAGEEGTSRWIRIAKSVKGAMGTGYVIVADIKSSLLREELVKISLNRQSVVQLAGSDNQLVATSADAGQLGSHRMWSNWGSDEKSGVYQGTTVQGDEAMFVFSTLGNSGWKLVSVIPVKELTSRADHILTSTYIAALIVALLALAIGLWTARTLAAPLQSMRNLMHEAASGDLKVRMAKRSRDEIGELCQSFNSMMEQMNALVVQANQTAGEVLNTARELGNVSRQTARSAEEIASATDQIAAGAVELAQEAEQGNYRTSRSTEQVLEFVAINGQMSDSASIVAEASRLGMEQLQELGSQTELTADKTSELVERINGLKGETHAVLEILGVMEQITRQTRILSLNAAIEAARSGSAGKGFMVVADEIRSLADQSGRSIERVSSIAGGIMREMGRTENTLFEVLPLFEGQRVQVMDTKGLFLDVQRHMNTFMERLTTVSEVTDQLVASQEALTEAMNSVSAVAEQSSASSQQVASLSSGQQMVSQSLVRLSEQLEQASLQLDQKLSRFKL